jgi:uncharacterized protein YhjY with autotransporter beta-barrel domain
MTSAMTLTSIPSSSTQVGQSYSQANVASGGSPAYTYSISAGTQPPGTTLDAATGTVAGALTTVGIFSYTVTACDATAACTSNSIDVTITLQPLTLGPDTLPAGTNGSFYWTSLSASGGTGVGYSFSITAGSLPAGIYFSSDGRLNGPLSAVGTYTFSVTVTDSGAGSVTKSYTLTVNPGAVLTFTLANLPVATTGTVYSATITATGGSGAGYSYSLSSGSLPTGLNWDGNGTISGTPSASGSSTFTVSATDSVGNTGSTSYVLAVSPDTTLTISPASLPAGTNGSFYWTSLSVAGGTGVGYNFSITAGSLPSGVYFSSDGRMNGPLSAAGSYTFTVTATDSGTGVGTRTYTLVVNPGAVLTLTPTYLPVADNGSAYSTTIAASGGSGTGYSYSLSSGSLPSGLNWNGNGTISGTPTASGNYTFSVTATDSVGNTGTAGYLLAVSPGTTLTISPASLPAGTNGSFYWTSLSVAGGTTVGYSFSISAGSLPSGIYFSSDGRLNGPLSAVGSYTFTVKATDSGNGVGTRTYTLVVSPGNVLSVSPGSLPVGTNGTSYTAAVVASGGTGTGYTYSLTAGSLPPGLSAGSNGAITGLPSTVGNYTFSVTATDSAGNTGTGSYVLSVGPGAVLTIGPASLPAATNGTAYTATITATGGTGSGYTYALTSGSLPTNFAMTSAGVITGTPTAVQSGTFTVTATDVAGNTGTRTYTLAVGPGAVLTVGPASLPAATNGTAYTATITATGGTGSGYTYAVTSGSLPTGLALASDGALSGTPSAVQSRTFGVTATDSDGNTGTRSYTLAVSPGDVLTISPVTLPVVTQGVPYTATLTAAGGVVPYTFSLASGTLPTGLSLTPNTGEIAGTTRASGTYTVAVRAVDSVGNYGTKAYTFTIQARPDPTRDQEVIGLMDSQFSTASRFAEGQINNLSEHLQGLHSGFTCGLSSQARLAVTLPVDPLERARRSAGVAQTTDGKLTGASIAAPAAAGAGPCDAVAPKFQVWTTGSLEFGRDQVQKFQSNAMTVGSDVKLKNRVIVGGAVGVGFGDNEIGHGGTRSQDRATTAMGFVSYRPAGDLFVDAVVGRSWMHFDSSRYVTSDQSAASGTRLGEVNFASLGASGRKRARGVGVLVYGQYDYLAIDLDGYAESGGSPYALTYGDAAQAVQIAMAGVRLDRDVPRAWGSVRPTARLEYRHRFTGSYDQAMAYSDMLDVQYTLSRTMQNRDLVSATVGLEVTRKATTFGFEYGTSATSLDSFAGGTFRVIFKTAF